MPRPKRIAYRAGNGANLGFEATLWAAPDKLRDKSSSTIRPDAVGRTP